MNSLWKAPVGKESVRLVASPESEEYGVFRWALDRCYLVGMDAEWKPVNSRKPGLSSASRVSILQLACRLNTDDESEGKDENSLEFIFLLDLLSLPVSAFWDPLKRMLVSPHVLKLGFKFKQDLLKLASSFSGPDAHCCFAKVEPYIDIGKLYLSCLNNSTDHESISLAAICQEILGITLCKDLQCSDWELRPLTLEQLAYAAADAHCLLAIYDALVQEATDRIGKEIPNSVQCHGSPRIGIAEVLSMIDGPSKSHVSGNVLRPDHGTALTMVKGIVDRRNLGISSEAINQLPAIHMRIAIKFAEKLYSNGADSSRGKRKPKTRRGRTNGQSKVENQEILEWRGPAPWDPSLGGDGVPKFLCDVMVEGLAKQLRNVGIDTACPQLRKSDPRALVEQAEKEGRVLLTRDVHLLRRRLVPQNLAYRVRGLAKNDQLTEVIQTFHLIISEDQLLSRCNKCNGEFIPEPLTPEEAAAAKPSTQIFPEYVLKECLICWQCSVCRHMYWQGNQFHRAMETFQAIARKFQAQATL